MDILLIAADKQEARPTTGRGFIGSDTVLQDDGRLGDAKAVEPLIRRLWHLDMPVLQAACAALAQLRDVRALEPLTGLFTLCDWHLRQAACAALGQLGTRGQWSR